MTRPYDPNLRSLTVADDGLHPKLTMVVDLVM